jgi:hypothetical protein
MWSNKDPRLDPKNQDRILVVVYRGGRCVQSFVIVIRKDYVVRMDPTMRRWLQPVDDWSHTWFWTEVPVEV